MKVMLACCHDSDACIHANGAIQLFQFIYFDWVMQLSKFRTLLQVRWSYWRLDWWFDWTTTASSPKAAAIAVIVTITVTSLTDLADEWHASNNINDAGEKGEDS
jgi:hypothetical protein